MPVSMVLCSMLFYVANGAMVGYGFGTHSAPYSDEWLASPCYQLGLLVFLAGFLINVVSDSVLIHLRKPGEMAYRIPHGGLFERVLHSSHTACRLVDSRPRDAYN